MHGHMHGSGDAHQHRARIRTLIRATRYRLMNYDYDNSGNNNVRRFFFSSLRCSPLMCCVLVRVLSF